MILGTVHARDDTEGLQIIIDGEEDATEKKYHYLASYSPTAGDRVLIEEIGDSYVVIGKVIEAYDESGIAKHADTANTATSASSASTATTATTANRVRQYNNTSQYVEFTYFNSNLWVRINGGTQFALAKG